MVQGDIHPLCPHGDPPPSIEFITGTANHQKNKKEEENKEQKHNKGRGFLIPLTHSSSVRVETGNPDELADSTHEDDDDGRRVTWLQQEEATLILLVCWRTPSKQQGNRMR